MQFAEADIYRSRLSFGVLTSHFEMCSMCGDGDGDGDGMIDLPNMEDCLAR